MRVFQTKSEKDPGRVFLTPREYQMALEKAPDTPTRLSIRYGAHSLRRQSMLGAPFSNLQEVDTPYGRIHLLRVDAKDSSDRPQQTRQRDVFISDTLVEDTKDFYGADYDGPIFRKSESTLTERYKETRQNLATATGNKDWLNFSSQDGRRYFATHAIFRHGLPIELVMQLGGWNSLQAMQPYMVLPEDVIARQLGEKGLFTSFDTATPDDDPEIPYRVNTAIETIQQAASGEYEDLSTEALAHKIGAALGDEVLNEVDNNTSDESTTGFDEHQTSFTMFGNDEQGVLDPIGTLQAAQATYVTALVYISWILSFGPLA